MRGDNPGESGELVGEGDGGLVVAEALHGAERPGSDGVGLALLRRGGEHRSGAVNQEHAQVNVAALGGRAEAANASGRSLPGREPEIAREVTPTGETARIADESCESCRREQPDSRDRAQFLDEKGLPAEGFEPVFDLADAPLEFSGLADELERSEAQGFAETAVGVTGELESPGDEALRAGGNGDALFAQQTAQRVDPRGPGVVSGSAEPVEGGELLLGRRLHRHGPDLLVAEGLEQRLGIRAIGLVALTVAADVLSRKKLNLVTELAELANPEMRGAAGFEQNDCRRPASEERQQGCPAEALPLADTPRPVRNRDLEDGLCQVHRDRRTLAHGLLLSGACASDSDDFGTSDADQVEGGVHLIVRADAFRSCGPLCGSPPVASRSTREPLGRIRR